MIGKLIPPAFAVIGTLGMIIYVQAGAVPAPVPAAPASPPPSPVYGHLIGAAGIVEPHDRIAEIAPFVSGVLTSVKVEAGDFVHKGDLLFTQDSRAAAAAAEQARAAVKVAVAEATQADAAYELLAAITDPKAVSRDEMIVRRSAKLRAAASLEAAQAALKSAETALELLQVRSPSDGTVLSLNLRPGNYLAAAAAGASPVLRLADLSQLYVRIDIDENDAGRFTAGSAAKAFLRGQGSVALPLRFVRVEPYIRPKQSLTGAPAERVDTRVLQVIYAFDRSVKGIYPGQQVDVSIEEKIRS